MNNLRRWGIIILFTAFNINISYQVGCQVDNVNHKWNQGQVNDKSVSSSNELFQMFMFQSIYSLVADFYKIDEDLVLMLGQISLILLAIVLFPCAFLSDFVSVRSVVISSSLMVTIGSILKTLASMPFVFSRNLFPLLFVGQIISQIPRAIALPYAGRLANLMLPSKIWSVRKQIFWNDDK